MPAQVAVVATVPHAISPGQDAGAFSGGMETGSVSGRGATWWQFLLSVVVSLVCTVLVALVAARVYRTAVLRTGGRVRLRELVPTLAK